MKACITLTLAIHGSLSSRLSLCSEEVGSASQNSGTIKKLLYADVTYGLRITNFLKDYIQQNKDDEKFTDVL